MMKVRLIGLALVAAMAFSAVAAASASAGTYDSEIETTFLQGKNEGSHTFLAGGVPVVCKTAVATSTQTGTKKEAGVFTKAEVNNVVPVYSECTVAGQTATVDFATGECKYNFGAPSGEASPFTVKTIGITCKSGGLITITAKTAGCTIKISPQTTTGTSTATNEGAGTTRQVKLKAAVTGITYTSSGGICGTAGTFATGKYEGTLIAKGYKNAGLTEQVGVFVTK